MATNQKDDPHNSAAKMNQKDDSAVETPGALEPNVPAVDEYKPELEEKDEPVESINELAEIEQAIKSLAINENHAPRPSRSESASPVPEQGSPEKTVGMLQTNDATGDQMPPERTPQTSSIEQATEDTASSGRTTVHGKEEEQDQLELLVIKEQPVSTIPSTTLTGDGADVGDACKRQPTPASTPEAEHQDTVSLSSGNIPLVPAATPVKLLEATPDESPVSPVLDVGEVVLVLPLETTPDESSVQPIPDVGEVIVSLEATPGESPVPFVPDVGEIILPPEEPLASTSGSSSPVEHALPATHASPLLTPTMVNDDVGDLSQGLQSMHLGSMEQPNVPEGIRMRYQCSGIKLNGLRCRWRESLMLRAEQRYYCHWHQYQDQYYQDAVRCIARQTKDNERCRASYYRQQVPEEDQLSFRCETHKGFARGKAFRLNARGDLSLYLLARPTATGASSLLVQAPSNLLSPKTVYDISIGDNTVISAKKFDELTAGQPEMIKKNIHRTIVEYLVSGKRSKSGCVYFIYKSGWVKGRVLVKIGNTINLQDRLLDHGSKCGFNRHPVEAFPVSHFVELLEMIIHELLTAHQMDVRCVENHSRPITHVEMFAFNPLKGESEESTFQAVMDILKPWITNWVDALKQLDNLHSI